MVEKLYHLLEGEANMSEMHSERVTYQTIKIWVLDAYYDFCRDRGLGKRWSHREVLGSIDYEFENTFQSPVENFMLCVVQLVLSGGWHSDGEQHMRKWIGDQLVEHGLEEILKNVPEEEAELFRHDLRILKII